MRRQQEVKTYRLSVLLRMIASGETALPQFQRGYTWGPEAVVDLLATMSKGWPIGALLLSEGPSDLGVQSISGGPNVNLGRVRLYILDGQQRLTSLYHVLTNTGDFIFYADLREQSEQRVRWIRRGKGLPPESITFADLVHESSFSSALRTSRDPERLLAARQLYAGDLVDDPELPVIILGREIPGTDVAQIFESLNRTGQKLDEFDLKVASLFSQGYDLRESLNEALQLYPLLSRFEVEGQEILLLISILASADPHISGTVDFSAVQVGTKSRAMAALTSQTVDDYWDIAVNVILDALAILREEFAIYDADSLPARPMLLTLSSLVYAKWPRGGLSAWFWRAVTTQKYMREGWSQVLRDLRNTQSGPLQPYKVDPAMLMEPVRGNRMLRMGIRSLLTRSGAVDVFTGQSLRDKKVFELSAPDLDGREFTMTNDSPLAGLILASEEGVRRIRQSKKDSGQMPLEYTNGTYSQLAPPLSLVRQEPDLWLSQRAVHLSRAFEELS